jgi:hypothetical protein
MDPNAVVSNICQYDVLLGKGPLSHRNPGNKRFRDIVRDRRAEYATTNRRRVKDVIARQIVASVESNGGRFLRNIQFSNTNSNDNVTTICWIVVDRVVALEKVKQSLRDCNMTQGNHISIRDFRQTSRNLSASSTSSVVQRQEAGTNTAIETMRNQEQFSIINHLLLNNGTNHQPSPFEVFYERNRRSPLVQFDQITIPSALVNLTHQETRIPPPQQVLWLQYLVMISGRNLTLSELNEALQILSHHPNSDLQTRMYESFNSLAQTTALFGLPRPRTIGHGFLYTDMQHQVAPARDTDQALLTFTLPDILAAIINPTMRLHQDHTRRNL